jgi:hypothetical protein
MSHPNDALASDMRASETTTLTLGHKIIMLFAYFPLKPTQPDTNSSSQLVAPQIQHFTSRLVSNCFLL